MTHLIFKYSLVLAMLLFVTTAFSQENKYLGEEVNISHSELIQLANNTNFNGTIASEIFKDEKNTYFAIDNNSIKSRYVKIRILEQSYSDNTIVNIGSSVNGGFMLFLVNNVLIDTDSNPVDIFTQYQKTAIKEEASLSNEELSIWLNKHDKYSKK